MNDFPKDKILTNKKPILEDEKIGFKKIKEQYLTKKIRLKDNLKASFMIYLH